MEAPNGHAHCMSMILGSAGESIPVGDGELCMGQWQRVLFIELDRSRPRRWICKVVGSLALALLDRDRRRRRALLGVELEDPELAAHHVHGDVVDGHAVDRRLRTSRGARGRARRGAGGAARIGPASRSAPSTSHSRSGSPTSVASTGE